MAGWLRRALLSLFILLASPLFLELASRLVHRGKAPLLPYYFHHGAAFLPGGMDLRSSFYGLPANRYVTDDWGARIADPAVARRRPGHGVFVLGDSQMLGYMLEFEDTFASRIAAAALGDRRQARILAAPADHPETYAAALASYAPRGLERQRLAVVGLNLGNDLDEMYSEAIDWSRDDSSPLGRFLTSHSFLYMDGVLVRSHLLEAKDEPLGINRILYMLTSDERIILARETVRTLDEVIARSVVADRVLVVIVPADIQVDPAEFQKYRRFYSTQQEFDRWNAHIAEYSAMMNSLEAYIAGQLAHHGRQVLRVGPLISRRDPSRSLFDRTSHHLTARSHQILAEAILAEIGGKL